MRVLVYALEVGLLCWLQCIVMEASFEDCPQTDSVRSYFVPED